MRTRRLPVVFAALAFAASACTSTPETSSAAPATTTQTTPVPSTTVSKPPEEPYLTATPTLELSENAARPGTRLKFGEQAVIPYYSSYAKGLLGVSVTVDTAPVTEEEIGKLALKDEDKKKIRGKTFFFVREKLTNIDGANLTRIRVPSMHATTRSGGWPGSVLAVGRSVDVTGCQEEVFAPPSFSTKGAEYETCELMFGIISDPIVSFSYTKAPYEDSPSHSVTWHR
ncbi:hypothetical protein [Streptoalloteichus hindustanus]|uniref:Lipoprotein n=1 Tax=Streptoalloteichus hindustanus TaxID=2017 RepID=A0A1M5MH99_STRHI|nr:hypothetical protein [Streptoalloteichus hindustanus]SHG76103.1 hypothetical protein SAMN05444320_113104 [Streptoalloteichus hindustanus]